MQAKGVICCCFNDERRRIFSVIFSGPCYNIGKSYSYLLFMKIHDELNNDWLPFIICIYYHISLAFSAACPKGLYRNGSICEPCPVGTYQPLKGAESADNCLACRSNFTTSSSGATSLTDCVGKYYKG